MDELPLRRLQAAAGSDGSINTGLVVLIVGVCLAAASLLGFWFWRLSRLRWLRAQSAKVLDEIEMEFVNNDDADLDDWRTTDDNIRAAQRCAPHLLPQCLRLQLSNWHTHIHAKHICLDRHASHARHTRTCAHAMRVR